MLAPSLKGYPQSESVLDVNHSNPFFFSGGRGRGGHYKIASIENLAREMQKRSVLDVHYSNLLYMGFVKVKILRTHLSIETQ